MTSQQWTPGKLATRDFNVSDLLSCYPLSDADANKFAVFDIAERSNIEPSHTFEYARWSSEGWQAAYHRSALPHIEVVDGSFRYEGAPDTWHLNFADPRLFAYYKTELFAQDEIQVAEHPSLGSLRERLLIGGSEPRTVDAGLPTPCTVTGVPRQCRVDIEPNKDAPHGLYGNRFAAAHRDVIERRTHCISPPTLSNILAIAAPECGVGTYTGDEIEYILATLVTGFSAARATTGGSLRIMTGFWGCGAFGGNRVLTPALQIVAAAWAGIHTLVFHTFDSRGNDDIASAQHLAN
ncbi:MAG: hypothetical protein AAF747_11915 [Planctomycetota bacterium]